MSLRYCMSFIGFAHLDADILYLAVLCCLVSGFIHLAFKPKQFFCRCLIRNIINGLSYTMMLSPPASLWGRCFLWWWVVFKFSFQFFSNSFVPFHKTQLCKMFMIRLPMLLQIRVPLGLLVASLILLTIVNNFCWTACKSPTFVRLSYWILYFLVFKV